MSTRVLNPEPVRVKPPRRTEAEGPLPRGGVTENEWNFEEPGGIAELDLAELNVHGPSHRILDEDAARALVTHWLLRELAPMLGIDPGKIEIHVDNEAESRNNARHSTGLAENGKVYLHPQRFDPCSQNGRSLLAHETAHAAQHLLEAPAPQDTGRAHEAAEHEAAAIAQAFSERIPVPRPRAALPKLASAAKEDAPDLAATVPTSRAREIAEIHRLLSGLWISDGDVFEVMRVLDTMPFLVAQQVVFLLGDDRTALAGNINPPHLGPHTASVIATFSALLPAELVDAIDLDVLGEGDWGEMTSEVKQAAREVLSRLTPKQKQKLLKSPNRIDIERISRAAGALPEEEKERKAAQEKIRQKEADLAAARKDVESMAQNPDAKELLKKVREVMQGRRDDRDDENASDSQRAIAALELMTPYQKTTLLQYVAEMLDAEGLVDTLLETLPDSYFFDSGPHTETLLSLVQARIPSKNIDFVVELLSYGLFDWAIRDYEAKFAYRILLSLPLSEQYRFRQRENGKYFLRLVQNLPEEVTKEKGYREIEVHKASKDELAKIKKQYKPDQKNTVDEEAGLYDAGLLYANKRAVSQELITDLLRKFETARKGGWKEGDAEALHQALAAVGNASLVEKGKFTARDQILTETVVHDLDSRGYIDELFAALSDNFLFSSVNRIATVKIMLSRDPVRASNHARELVSYGFVDWMVTDREAYLAYLCVKALPDDERASFIKNDAWAWKRIQSEMSEDMRQSRDLNIYVGDKEGKDRASVLGQIADESTWTENNAPRLDGLIRIAIAMTEHKFVFERSKQFKAYEKGKPNLNALVTKYKLAENDRQEWSPDILKGTKWYEEGLFSTIRTIWKGLVFLFDNNLLLLRRSVGGVNIDLNELQDVLGGDISGVQLSDPNKPKDQKQEPNPDANKLTVLLDMGAHALTVSVPDLMIDSVNFQTPDTTIEAGSIRLKNLRIRAAYDSADMNQPTLAEIDAGSFQIDDLLLAMRESMVTATRFLLTTLHLGAGTKDTTTSSKAVPRGGYFPIPLLGPLVSGVYNLLKVKGWGPDTPATEMKRGAEQVRALDLTFGHLEIQGLTTSGGQTVGNVKVADFALRIGLNKTTVLRAKIASLEDRIKRKRALKDETGAGELEKQKQQAAADLEKLKADEDWMIAAQQRIIHEKLSADEQKKLQDRIDQLKFEAEGGQFLDIGSIDVTGIAGNVTVKTPLHLEGLHGEGKSNEFAAGLGIGIVTDAKLIEQMAEGKAPTPFSDRGGEFRLDIDKLHAGGVSVGGGQVRSSSDIQAKMKEIEKYRDKPEFAGFYEELENLLPLAQRYEQYVEIGVSALSNTQLADYQKLRTILAKDPSIVFGTIDLVRAHLDVNFSTGGIGIGADQATLKNVTLPEKGLSVDEFKGTNIKANAAVSNGLAGWLDWKKNLTGGGVSAGLIEISGARNRNSGLLFEKATLKGGDVDVRGRGNLATAKFDTLTVEGLGLEPRLNLMKRRLAALEKNRKPAARERKERDKLRKDIPALEALSDRRVLAVAVRNKAKTADERVAADQALLDLDELIAASLAQYGAARLQLDEFGIQATGAGDVLSDVLDGGLNVSTILRRGGVNIQGTGGQDHQVLKHAAFGYTSPGPDDEKGAIPTAVELGPVKLNATVTQDEKTNNITVALDQLDIPSISLSEMMLTGLDESKGGTKIWSSGRSSLSDLKFAGSLVFAPVGNPEGDYRLARIGITSFDIASLNAAGLGYANSDLKVEVRANSGTVTGVHAEDMQIELPADPQGDAVILGKARIESISNADISAALPGGLELTHGLLNARKLGIQFLEGGGKRLSAGDLSLTAAELRGPDGWARFSLENLSGAITLDDTGYTIHDVKLARLTASSLDWRAGATARVSADKPVELKGLSVDGKITTEPVDAPVKKGQTAQPGEKPKKDTRVVGVRINRFKIESITGDHITYKDGDTVIDVGSGEKSGAADPEAPKFMKKYRPFFIENFTMTDVDWKRDKGIQKGEFNVEKYGASVVYKVLEKDLSTHLIAGGALTGSGMHATFTGPNTGTATLGKIEKAAGFFKNKDISTRVGAASIMESFTFGENFVEMNNLVVDNVAIGNTTYGAGTDRAISLKDGYIDKVTVDKVHVDYEKTKEEGEDKTNIKGVKIGEVKFESVRAYDLAYDGKSTEMVDGKPVEKTQHLEGKRAHIERLRFVNIEYDPVQALTKFGIRVEEDPGKTKYPGVKPQAFGISGIAGKFVSKFSDGTDTVAQLAASLSGGPASGDNITLQTLTVGVEEGTKKPITRTAVSGTFNLTRLGLESISASYKDREGVTTTVSGLDGSSPSIEFTNLAPQFNPNGTLIIPNISAQAANFQIKRGDLTADIPLLDIKNLAVKMSGLGTAAGIDKFRVDLGSLSVSKALRIALVVHKKQTTQADVDKAKANPGSKLFADPLGGLKGKIILHTGYGAQTIPIEDGKIDFDKSTPYIVGIDHKGIYVSKTHYHVLEKDLPGVHENEGNRGKLYLQELVEGSANQPPQVDTEAPKEKPIDLELESGGLTLGKGKMGISPSGKADSESFYIELPDAAGGENTIIIPNHKIGELIEINIPKFHATGGAFPGGGQIGDVALDLGISVQNLARLDFTVNLDVHSGTIKDIGFGDAALAIDSEALKKLPAPTAKQINPKAEEKK